MVSRKSKGVRIKRPASASVAQADQVAADGGASAQQNQSAPQQAAATIVHERSESEIFRGPRDLPNEYGDNHIYVVVRDPYWLFTYWEIQQDYRDNVLNRLGGRWDDVTTVLRTYGLTQGDAELVHHVTLPPEARNWYLNVAPNRGYFVELGMLHRDGRYIVLARSNTVQTPRAGMSEIIDEQWMGIDFDTMYALSGGFETGKSSMELQKLMEERMQGAVTSGSGVGAISSLSSPVKHKQRGFWFVLDCELIVYGATEPDAKVTLQGEKIALRPDGTFSVRFALPDGYYHLDAQAQSADGKETRTIIPIVQRTTEVPETVLVED